MSTFQVWYIKTNKQKKGNRGISLSLFWTQIGFSVDLLLIDAIRDAAEAH